ncbi:MAG: PspA/IM30 family protein [Oscillospiraceae bacterium]|nr:PspA/IM30 family protein [Oscillospiraceae bacterium]
MGIFSRISDIFKANINDMLDKAEDPEKLVKQIILDMQKELTKSTQALGKAVASERMVEKQYRNACAVSASWEARAKAALKAGDTELAKKALASKVKADEDVANYREMYETISNQTEAIRSQVEALKAKMQEAKSREAMLIARSQMADTQRELAQSMGGIDTSSSFDKLARMEERIERKEAEAAAFSEILGAGKPEEVATFEELERSAKVDTELERLMTEMGMMPEASTDDQLAALQAEVAAAAAEAQDNLAEAGAPAET